MSFQRLTVVVAACALAACAETAPFPPPPEEVLLVVDSTADQLSIIPTAAPNTGTDVALGGVGATPVSVAARAGIALVPLGGADAVAVVDLAAGTVLRTISLAAGSGATGAAIVDDSIGYVADPGLGTVTRVNYLTGDTAAVAVGGQPRALVFTRGKLFVLDGALDGSFEPTGASYLLVIDPVTNARVATGVDSIPLPGPGNARYAAVGADGLLYVMNVGKSASGEGRLSIVNPVTREELANFGGFGNSPGGVATAGELLYVASRSEGLMVFDTHARELLRGAGEGVAIAQNSAVATDAAGRIYALSAGPCSGAAGAQAHILRSDLVEQGTIPLAECALAAVVATIPNAP